MCVYCIFINISVYHIVDRITSRLASKFSTDSLWACNYNLLNLLEYPYVFCTRTCTHTPKKVSYHHLLAKWYNISILDISKTLWLNSNMRRACLVYVHMVSVCLYVCCIPLGYSLKQLGCFHKKKTRNLYARSSAK